MNKPKDLEEVRDFIKKKLSEEYGTAILSTENSDKIVIDTETNYHGNSDVWIDLCYFH